MKQEKFSSFALGDIELIILDLNEWDDLMNHIKNNINMILSLESNNKIDDKQFNAINRNKCIPLILNDGFIKLLYNADTKYVSVVHGMLGRYINRLWWSRNGSVQNIAKTEEELNGTKDVLLRKFISWWSKSRHEKRTMGHDVGVKFGICHVSEWIETLPGITYETDGMPIKNRNDIDLMNFAYIKSWALATELVTFWVTNNMISMDNEGGCSI